MSHTCPDCGEFCNCHGDIDDCEMNTEETYVDCVHGCQLTQLHDKHRHINTPDLVERTNREISQLKMVSPETARLLLADNDRLRKAIEEAPHELMCNTSTFGKWDITIKNKECNCWKRNALEGGE